MSQTEALQAAGNFGGMFRTIGLGTRRTADMSRRLAELGADMASFNNEDPTDMLDRLRSGLAGEAEPLRRFGVLHREARVKTEAYRSGIAKAGAKLTEQQKVQARYNLILRDTTLQQGDVARTGDSWAGNCNANSAHASRTWPPRSARCCYPAITDVVDPVQRLARRPAEPEAGDRRLHRRGRRARQRRRNGAKVLGPSKTLGDAFWQSARTGWSSGRRPPTRAPANESANGGQGFATGSTPASPTRPRSARWARTARDALQTGARRRDSSSEPPQVLTRATWPQPRPPSPRGNAGGRKAAPRLAPPRRRRTPRDAAAQRNQWFDASSPASSNRLQDLGLRQQLARLRTIAAGGPRSGSRSPRTPPAGSPSKTSCSSIYREQRSVQEQIGDQIKAANRR